MKQSFEISFSPWQPGLPFVLRHRGDRALLFACAFVFACSCGTAQIYTVTRFAGLPAAGYADETGALARFSNPGDVAMDRQGNIFVADWSIIRKLSPSGVVTTVTNVPTKHVNVNGPWPGRIRGWPGIAVDRSGNLLFADNHAVWKITVAGEIALLAGAPGEDGYRDGAGATARFNFYVSAGDFFPDIGFGNVGIAVTDEGIVYVADVGNHAIRRVSRDGEVTTLAGRPRIGRRDGSGNVAEFYQPERLALDAAGNLLVADVGNEVVRRVTPGGEVTTVGGDQGKVPRLCSVAVDGAGTIYVGVARWYSDSARFPHSSIYKLGSNGDKTLLAGSAFDAGGADGAGPEARFDFPFGLAVDGDNNVIVADTGNRAIRRMTSAGVVTTLAGAARAHTDGVGDTARFYTPGRMTSDASGNLYVLDPPRVRKITPARAVTTIGSVNASTATGIAFTLNADTAAGIAVTPNGDVLVSDASGSIYKITPAGAISRLWSRFVGASSVPPPAPFQVWPRLGDIAVDSTGNIFIAAGNAILKLTPGANPVMFAVVDSRPGAGRFTSEFDPPLRFTIDGADNLVIVDADHRTLRQIDRAGRVTTIAGADGTSSWLDGPVDTARFFNVHAVAVDRRGTVYAAEFDQVIRKISNGMVSTLLLLPPSGGRSPLINSFTCGENGVLYFTDTAYSVIWKATPWVDSGDSGLVNLSVRADVRPERPLTAGVSVAGGDVTLLLRGVGPGVAPFVAGATTAGDPRLELLELNGVEIGTNNDWSGSPLVTVATAVSGAFALARDSTDAGLLRTTARPALARLHVTTPGLALLEAFAPPRTEGGRITNLSVRHEIAADVPLIAGFTVRGAATKLLIRGVGPSLRMPAFGVTDSISAAVLTLYDSSGRAIATNSGWPAELAAAFEQAGAFPLITSSNDAALVITLPPSVYSAVLHAANKDAGQALLEIYVLP